MVGLNRLFFRLFMALFILAGMTLLTHSIAKVTRAAIRHANQPANGNLIPLYLPLVRRGLTTACGEITTDTTWGTAGSPYHVTCDVIVPAGVTLTIEAGVVAQFADTDDDLIISGTLNTAGTESAPISFQPLNEFSPGRWGRVAFMAGSSGVLDHVILEYGGRLIGSDKGMVYIASDAVQVIDSIVQYSANTGIYIHDASPLISGTQIVANRGYFHGGGLYNDTGSPIILNNTFLSNTVSEGCIYTMGGGLYNEGGSPVIQNNIFAGNVAQYTYAGQCSSMGYGGGIFSFGEPIILNNVFTSNLAEGYGYGGGIYIVSNAAVIHNNIIVNNRAEYNSGIYSYNTLLIDFNDLWNNNYGGIIRGSHDISADPLLVDPANGDFHLAPGSPCIDAGDPDNYPPTDFEGDSRPQGAAPDIGADEYHSPP